MSDFPSAIAAVRDAVCGILRIRPVRPGAHEFQVAFVGTGWCFSPRRYLATAHHVFDDGKARNPSDKFYAFVVPDNGPVRFWAPLLIRAQRGLAPWRERWSDFLAGATRRLRDDAVLSQHSVPARGRCGPAHGASHVGDDHGPHGARRNDRLTRAVVDQGLTGRREDATLARSDSWSRASGGQHADRRRAGPHLGRRHARPAVAAWPSPPGAEALPRHP